MLSYLPKSISKLINKFNKSSIWFKTLSIILLCLILSLIFKKEVKEGFRQEKKFVVLSHYYGSLKLLTNYLPLIGLLLPAPN